MTFSQKEVTQKDLECRIEEQAACVWLMGLISGDSGPYFHIYIYYLLHRCL